MNTNPVVCAEIIARLAHKGQIDKAGVDYAEHCKAVSELAAAAAPPMLKSKARIVGWLHDTVEDTPLDLNHLFELGFRGDVLDAIRLLTHTHEHTHAEYLTNIRDATTPGAVLARIVKRADIAHNSSPEREIPGMSREKLQRRYEKALAILDGKGYTGAPSHARPDLDGGPIEVGMVFTCPGNDGELGFRRVRMRTDGRIGRCPDINFRIVFEPE